MARRVLRGAAIILVAFPEPITTMLGVALLFASYARFGRPKADRAERLEALLRGWVHYHKPIGYMMLSQRTVPYRIAGAPQKSLLYRRMTPMQPIKCGIDIGDQRCHASQQDYLTWCQQTGRVPLAQHVAYYGAMARAMKKSLPRRANGVGEGLKRIGSVRGHAGHLRSGPWSSPPAVPAGSRSSWEAVGMAAAHTIPVKWPWGAETRSLARSSR